MGGVCHDLRTKARPSDPTPSAVRCECFPIQMAAHTESEAQAYCSQLRQFVSSDPSPLFVDVVNLAIKLHPDYVSNTGRPGVARRRHDSYSMMVSVQIRKDKIVLPC